MDWNRIELFKGIDLNDSFVLNWACENNQLTFELEASIWPESEFYYKPKEGEFTCYRKATLRLANAKSINGLKYIDSVIPTSDPDGSIDYGNIETFIQTTIGFKLSGEFGDVSVGELTQ
jgi:hypothetical protein